MFKQISLILDARKEGDTECYIRNVEGLDHLMFFWWDGEYNNTVNDAGKKYKETLSKMPNPGTEKDNLKKLQAKYNFTQTIFKALMSLVGRCGFLPIREIEGVISKYDGEMLDKLIEEEKKEIEDRKKGKKDEKKIEE